ncbi:response regulator transcription factor [Nocardia niigatensis]|uniref:response regulator transcription factor n=1 Tax=Nocardia niigatensis TaxID=209249 RepID=UPI000592A172|nr:response regulator transcription factor [Nocardia niigatensis]
MAERSQGPSTVCRVGIVEDHCLTITGLRQVLAAEPGLELVADAATVTQLLAITSDLDLAVLDLRLPDGSSPADNVEQLRRVGIPTLVLTSGDDPYLIRAAARAGVLGVVLKAAEEKILTAVIRNAAQGQGFPTAEWAAAIDDDAELGEVGLTPRQRDVLAYFADGMSADKVARKTGLSENTVNDYLRRIRLKYAESGRRAPSKIDLYKRALEDGWLPRPLPHWPPRRHQP